MVRKMTTKVMARARRNIPIEPLLRTRSYSRDAAGSVESMATWQKTAGIQATAIRVEMEADPSVRRKSSLVNASIVTIPVIRRRIAENALLIKEIGPMIKATAHRNQMRLPFVRSRKDQTWTNGERNQEKR